MVTANEVADYLIYRFNECGDSLSNLKLQKMLYYAQGWYLGETGNPLFDDEIQAWVHGPVVVSQYERFKKDFYAYEPILRNIEVPPQFEPDIKKHLDEIFEIHNPFSAWELESAAHNESPWKEARAGLPLDQPSKSVITHDSMKRYFMQRLSEDHVQEENTHTSEYAQQ